MNLELDLLVMRRDREVLVRLRGCPWDSMGVDKKPGRWWDRMEGITIKGTEKQD